MKKSYFFLIILFLVGGVLVFLFQEEQGSSSLPEYPREEKRKVITSTAHFSDNHSAQEKQGISVDNEHEAVSLEPASKNNTGKRENDHGFYDLKRKYAEFSVDPDVDTIAFRCLEEDLSDYYLRLDHLGETHAERARKGKIRKILDACLSEHSKDYMQHIAGIQEQIYEEMGGNQVYEMLTSDSSEDVGENEINDYYKMIVDGLLDSYQAYMFFSGAMITRMRKDLPLLNDFMDQNGYNSYRPGPGGRDYLEVGYVEDAAILIRCSRYPAECVRESPMMNRLCLVDTLACVHDFYMFLILSQGRDRLIATYGVANFALYMAGYPLLEVRIPTLDG